MMFVCWFVAPVHDGGATCSVTGLTGGITLVVSPQFPVETITRVNKNARGEFHGCFALPTSNPMLFATSLPFAFHF